MFQLQIASRSSRSIVSLRSLYFDRPRRLSESSTEGLNFGAFAGRAASGITFDCVLPSRLPSGVHGVRELAEARNGGAGGELGPEASGAEGEKDQGKEMFPVHDPSLVGKEEAPQAK